MSETTDVSALIRDLNRCLSLLARDTTAVALVAGALPGPAGVALADPLRTIAADGARDVQGVAARIASMSGTPEVAATDALTPPQPWQDAITWLVEMQQETLEALVDAIPADADDVEGEATEHLLEHLVARKREVLDLLGRALR